MFATLLGGLPRPTGADDLPLADDDAAVLAVLAAQVDAGLEPLTDGRVRSAGFVGPFAGLRGVAGGTAGPRLTGPPAWDRPLTVEAWRFAAASGAGIVKQALPGPYTLARRLGAAADDDVSKALSLAVRSEIRALADAGCPFIEIEERDAHLIGADQAQRARFVRAHEHLLEGLEGVHVSLAILGGNADAAGIETILVAPYPSLAVDLIDGPDNWRLVQAAPGDRGIVCGVMSTRAAGDDGPEIMIWAAAYAASGNGRGPSRVGLATAGGLEHLSWQVAKGKMTRLGHAARLAASAPSEAAEHLDPRSLDIRSAALGRNVKPVPRPERRRPAP